MAAEKPFFRFLRADLLDFWPTRVFLLAKNEFGVRFWFYPIPFKMAAAKWLKNRVFSLLTDGFAGFSVLDDIFTCEKLIWC